MANILFRLRQALNTLRIHMTKPLHIEFVLSDHCNLNCKCCTHYASLAPAEFEPLSQLEKNMAHISKLRNFETIEDVYLIGGEPLLYPHLKEAIKLARRYFEKNNLQIFTNGLLLKKMDAEFWQLCRDNNVEIALTRYPVKVDYDALEQLCHDNAVKVSVFGDRGEHGSFYRYALDPSKSQNKWVRHFKCYNFGCVSIIGDKIFPCSISGCITHINNAFGSNFEWQAGDYLEIDKLTDAKEILRMRNRPVPFCSYCKRFEIIDYGPSQRAKSEWLD